MVTRMPAGPITQITGTALAVRGHDVDTDRIMPARFLRALTFEGLGDHVFEDDRRLAASHGDLHPFDEPSHRDASVLLVNGNFGCGSSREHAPQGLLRRGIRALVGESFSEIFFGNATALGMPCLCADRETVEVLMCIVEGAPRLAVTIDLKTLMLQVGEHRAAISLSAALREAFLDGSWDTTGLLLEAFDAVRTVARHLPYMTSFTTVEGRPL
jgi:3-isopropylmalate/(R)-2-methylmalate dehydratase small subunit